MKVDCTIDGKTLTLTLNSNKPLSKILRENIGNDTVNTCTECCGRCIVLMDDEPVLSCLVPAFELNGKNITTFENFQRTRQMKDIEKAYEAAGVHPCCDCYPSRSLLIESLVNEGVEDRDVLKRELSIVKCSCMDVDDQISVVHKAIEMRRNRRVRRS